MQCRRKCLYLYIETPVQENKVADYLMLNDPLTPQEIEELWNSIKKKNLRVFYGVSKLNKIFKKRSIVVMFENCTPGLPEEREKKISRWMQIIHVRNQTIQEKEDAIYKNRIFTTYNTFIDEKPWNGDWEAALHNNYLADENHVSKKERLIIKDKLGIALRKYYNFDVPYQATLEFF